MKREIREQRLHDLVQRYVTSVTGGGSTEPSNKSIELIAHSPESPIALALVSRLDELAGAGVTVRAIFASTAADAALAPWLAGADWVRLVRDPRLMEVHEQLVLGGSCCWSGDAMRRGATKTDLFESLNEGSQEAASLGRKAFGKLSAFATVVRPRRVTASLNALPQDRHSPSLPAATTVLPAAVDAMAEDKPFITRH